MQLYEITYPLHKLPAWSHYGNPVPSFTLEATPQFYGAVSTFYNKILMPRYKKLRRVGAKTPRGVIETETVSHALSVRLLVVMQRQLNVMYREQPPMEMDCEDAVWTLRKIMFPAVFDQIEDPLTAERLVYSYFPGISGEYADPSFRAALREELRQAEKKFEVFLLPTLRDFKLPGIPKMKLRSEGKFRRVFKKEGERKMGGLAEQKIGWHGSWFSLVYTAHAVHPMADWTTFDIKRVACTGRELQRMVEGIAEIEWVT